MDDKKFYTGTIDQFKSFMNELSVYPKGTPEYIKYNDLKKSTIYISENFGESLNDLDNYAGAVYANGTIIAGPDMRNIYSKEEVNNMVNSIGWIYLDDDDEEVSDNTENQTNELPVE